MHFFKKHIEKTVFYAVGFNLLTGSVISRMQQRKSELNLSTKNLNS